MAAMALSAHWVLGAGARLGKAENNPAAVVGQERVTGEHVTVADQVSAAVIREQSLLLG